MSENLNKELIVGVTVGTNPGPDPPDDPPSESVRTLGRLFASLGGDQRGSYPRMNIVLSLLKGENGTTSGASVRQLAESVSLSTSATSQHLKRLELDGIVKGRRNPANRQEVIYSLDGGMLYDIVRLVRIVFPSLFPSGL